MEGHGWVVPRCFTANGHVRVKMDEAYSVLLAAWETKRQHILENYGHKYNDPTASLPWGDPFNTVQLPPMPKAEWFRKCMNFTRGVFWQLWLSWPHSEEEDVRDEIVEWAVENLAHVMQENRFKAILEWKVHQNMHYKITVQYHQSVLPDIYEYVDEVKRTRTEEEAVEHILDRMRKKKQVYYRKSGSKRRLRQSDVRTGIERMEKGRDEEDSDDDDDDVFDDEGQLFHDEEEEEEEEDEEGPFESSSTEESSRTEEEESSRTEEEESSRTKEEWDDDGCEEEVEDKRGEEFKEHLPKEEWERIFGENKKSKRNKKSKKRKRKRKRKERDEKTSERKRKRERVSLSCQLMGKDDCGRELPMLDAKSVHWNDDETDFGELPQEEQDMIWSVRGKVHMYNVEGGSTAEMTDAEAKWAIKDVAKTDETLSKMLLVWRERCTANGWTQRFEHACQGIASPVVAIYSHHLGVANDCKEMQPPVQENKADAKVGFSEPGNYFRFMVREMLQVMFVAMLACDFSGVGAVRWNWIHILLKKCEKAEAERRKEESERGEHGLSLDCDSERSERPIRYCSKTIKNGIAHMPHSFCINC
jgi:hypothetical protein